MVVVLLQIVTLTLTVPQMLLRRLLLSKNFGTNMPNGATHGERTIVKRYLSAEKRT